MKVRRKSYPGSRAQDLDRRFDTTQLREKGHGTRVHRDYAAHFFRWGWAARFVESRKTRVLEIGCGQDTPLFKVLSGSLNTVPESYVGVDLNSVKKPGCKWTSWHDKFNFVDEWKTLKIEKGYDLIVSFEVIEHMHPPDGLKLLERARKLASDDATFLLSTPVFNGKKMAANHLHEYYIDELQELIEEGGWKVERRHGTFASWNDMRRVCTDDELKLVDELGEFLSTEVLACFLASKYPDASRNNVWVLKPNTAPF
jgi:2-polyprenyl-3-methyl-5-hydroxy-6-metoxy-1,4-benzoquinol methylase